MRSSELAASKKALATDRAADSLSLLNVKSNLFKILRGGRRPSHLHRLWPRRVSAFQRALYPGPNLGSLYKIAARRSAPSGLNLGKKTTLFRQVAIDRFARQLIRASAHLAGDAREFSFLFAA